MPNIALLISLSKSGLKLQGQLNYLLIKITHVWVCLDSMFAAQTYLSVDQKTDCGSMSMMEDKQYWCEQWVLAHREGNIPEEKKYVAKKCNYLNILVTTCY